MMCTYSCFKRTFYVDASEKMVGKRDIFQIDKREVKHSVIDSIQKKTSEWLPKCQECPIRSDLYFVASLTKK